MGKPNTKEKFIKGKNIKEKNKNIDSSILYFNYLKFLIIGDAKTGKTNLIKYILKNNIYTSIIISHLNSRRR